MQEGRRRRIAELALEGKKINTRGRQPKPRMSPEAQRIEGLIRQLAEYRRIREEAVRREIGNAAHAWASDECGGTGPLRGKERRGADRKGRSCTARAATKVARLDLIQVVPSAKPRDLGQRATSVKFPSKRARPARIRLCCPTLHPTNKRCARPCFGSFPSAVQKTSSQNGREVDLCRTVNIFPILNPVRRKEEAFVCSH